MKTCVLGAWDGHKVDTLVPGKSLGKGSRYVSLGLSLGLDLCLSLSLGLGLSLTFIPGASNATVFTVVGVSARVYYMYMVRANALAKQTIWPETIWQSFEPG